MDAERVSCAPSARAFGEELDAIKRKAILRMGEEDVRYVTRLDRFSRAMEVVGRVLIHVSFEPVTFLLGVTALWLHKQLQATEIGHTALHGAYDKLPGAERWASKTFRWDTPIDEESWRQGHNVRHHGNTNVDGRDPDVEFGTVRLTEQTPYRASHRHQHWYAALLLFPNFGFVMNTHFTGLNDVLLHNGPHDRLDVLPDLSRESVRGAWKRSLRKYVPHYLKEYVFFPALAGPFFWKVMLANYLAGLARDVYTAATIFCGHVGDDVSSWPEGTKAAGRADWYRKQIEATNNYEVSLPVSILCGGLDRQIEHHLFPTLPPHRLREISPEVRAVCAKYAVPYKTDTWGRMLRRAFRHIARLSHEGGVRGALRAMA